MAKIRPAHRSQDAPVQRPGVGSQVPTGEEIPVPATWRVDAHGKEGADECPGSGHRRALAARHPAPGCPECARSVTWVLDHQSTSVAGIEGD